MGKLYDLIEEKNKSILVPVDKWDGECWRTMFETLSKLVQECDPWETFARFMQEVLKS